MNEDLIIKIVRLCFHPCIITAISCYFIGMIETIFIALMALSINIYTEF